MITQWPLETQPWAQSKYRYPVQARKMHSYRALPRPVPASTLASDLIFPDMYAPSLVD